MESDRRVIDRGHPGRSESFPAGPLATPPSSSPGPDGPRERGSLGPGRIRRSWSFWARFHRFRAMVSPSVTGWWEWPVGPLRGLDLGRLSSGQGFGWGGSGVRLAPTPTVSSVRSIVSTDKVVGRFPRILSGFSPPAPASDRLKWNVRRAGPGRVPATGLPVGDCPQGEFPAGRVTRGWGRGTAKCRSLVECGPECCWRRA